MKVEGADYSFFELWPENCVKMRLFFTKLLFSTKLPFSCAPKVIFSDDIAKNINFDAHYILSSLTHYALNALIARAGS